MIGILSTFAQLERETIKERTKLGKEGRAKSGLWSGGGRVPIGYRYDNNDNLDDYSTFSVHLKVYKINKIKLLTLYIMSICILHLRMYNKDS